MIKDDTMRMHLYTQDDLAVMWCKLNAGRHPLVDGWHFNPQNVAGAMALLTILAGPSKCMKKWREKAWLLESEKTLERRRWPRD